MAHSSFIKISVSYGSRMGENSSKCLSIRLKLGLTYSDSKCSSLAFMISLLFSLILQGLTHGQGSRCTVIVTVFLNLFLIK